MIDPLGELYVTHSVISEGQFVVKLVYYCNIGVDEQD
jgi:hypothetical protein